MTKEQKLMELLEVFYDTLANFAEGRYSLEFHAETVRCLLADVERLRQPEASVAVQALKA
ncbi:hypothetical protein [Deinococcus multiflagellatus]|uniref:Uncharacterized protein n=1 Tax=Deinococcus multiflagellatus TaxID=1656887 RepID=A0ABW1ZNV8_9DEIO|nr:hypothetical protein [Deinococcus multiflagellatus]MBZ9715234.1 hypothetical protein [Deinococcus multiflagellatus]